MGSNPEIGRRKEEIPRKDFRVTAEWAMALLEKAQGLPTVAPATSGESRRNPGLVAPSRPGGLGDRDVQPSGIIIPEAHVRGVRKIVTSTSPDEKERRPETELERFQKVFDKAWKISGLPVEEKPKTVEPQPLYTDKYTYGESAVYFQTMEGADVTELIRALMDKELYGEGDNILSPEGKKCLSFLLEHSEEDYGKIGNRAEGMFMHARINHEINILKKAGETASKADLYPQVKNEFAHRRELVLPGYGFDYYKVTESKLPFIEEGKGMTDATGNTATLDTPGDLNGSGSSRSGRRRRPSQRTATAAVASVVAAALAAAAVTGVVPAEAISGIPLAGRLVDASSKTPNSASHIHKKGDRMTAVIPASTSTSVATTEAPKVTPETKPQVTADIPWLKLDTMNWCNDAINAYAILHGADPDLVKIYVMVRTAGNPFINKPGGKGVVLMTNDWASDVAKGMGKASFNLMDPNESLDIFSTWLAVAMNLTNGNVGLVAGVFDRGDPDPSDFIQTVADLYAQRKDSQSPAYQKFLRDNAGMIENARVALNSAGLIKPK